MRGHPPPILHLLAGINGAGKTTFFYRQIKPRADVPFINADEIQRHRWPDEIDNPQRSYEAATIAATQRETMIRQGRSFATETVFSHPSKLELIRQAQHQGFMVALYHIHVATPELAAMRVETRRQLGGHDVPVDKLYSRFPRTLTYLREAVRLAERTLVFDNSRIGKTHRHLLSLSHGLVTRLSEDLPDWALAQYGPEIRRYRGET
ncbi:MULTISPECIES: zeta toxin family protein [unclassified Halomonas]|uniref:zeta toxin family protein n=1 Tax=unclassified Halomonas TaxID=2609666 RepID=UPI001BCC9FE9|nr:zeta toxin family protein [Halomonas sp.]MBS8267625.1 hypothetical protein [Halomonas litopenaei]MCJ8284698.1 zeta toxin family protein [Halomonas sp.]NQY69752.1 zeta toxin family protein [Halomonas sp.]